jgi:hypothetical protein
MFHPMKLGRVAKPVPANAPSLRRHAMAQATAAPVLDRTHLRYRPQIFANQSVGDCTCAAIGNAVLGQAALWGYTVDITDAKVLALYSAVSGYDPAKPETDKGAVEVDVLSYQATHGFDGGGQTPYVGLWASIEPGDLNLLRVATERLGVGYLGLNLALADQQGGVWDTDTPAADGDPTPGSWGGHAALLWSWTGLGDTDTVLIATWGTLQRATWRWVGSRLDEAHALVHPQLVGPGALNNAGVDREALEADIAGFAAVP